MVNKQNKTVAIINNYIFIILLGNISSFFKKEKKYIHKVFICKEVYMRRNLFQPYMNTVEILLLLPFVVILLFDPKNFNSLLHSNL